MGTLTKDSWEIIARDIIDIVEDNKFYGSDEFTISELKDYLTDAGLITVIEE